MTSSIEGFAYGSRDGPMTLQQLTYFLAAAKHGSFSAAADTLHLAQPSLSEQVRRLEAELGVALFTRAGRRLELTEAGRLLRPEAERTLSAASQAAQSVREVRDLTGGTASFGTFGNAPYYLLSDLVQDFRHRHPGVKVRIVGLNSSEVADAVREGELEGGLIALPIDDRGLDVRPAIRDEVLYMTSEEPPAVATIELLATQPLILNDAAFGWNDPTRRQLLGRAQQAGVTLEPEIEVETLEAALDLAARGLGVTVATRRIALGRGFTRRLNWASFDPPLWDTYAFITRRGAVLSPATRALMAIFEKRLEILGRRIDADTGGSATPVTLEMP